MNRWGNDKDAFLLLGQALEQRHLDQLSTQLSVIQSVLVNFAHEHEQDIKRNSEFRGKFTRICEVVGVDVLELVLTGTKLDNYHIALSVRIVEISQETRDINGGLLAVKELVSILQSKNVPIAASEHDIETSVAILNQLGRGFEILNINGKKWLRSAGSTISSDQKTIYELCGFMGGYVSYRLLRDNYDWDRARCKTVIDEMILNGLLWLDAQQGETLYWVPSWISRT
ncbi:sucrose non-fermenting [Suhomyces tanzawaensis NRRL Y-17324]|uniref:Sucrose non-fermenting n=1 Tax=Suhomyces tanzawaensis NRRL Y-17324 TaxID=984487 RepID=A0A1E4SMT7_9ASCO|nr:sucrose non-fermenting [Suhomyces tanzawaensis NRRL Y-17324]ODV80844.1 sucrose non-fermenting [Suhomyces tanzawaensis NRRL Y-17324]